MKCVPFILLLAGLLLLGFAAGLACDDDDDDDDDNDNDDTSIDDDTGGDDDDDDNDDDDNNDDDDDDTSPVDDDTTGDDDDDDNDDNDDDDDDDDDDDNDDDNDDDDTTPDDCTTLEDPDDAGAYSVVAWEYGDENDPDAQTTNVLPYFRTPAFYVRWVRGIPMSAVPLHGLGHYPDGDGPFPLVLIVHGNHSPEELSYPGYGYLTEHLATHGIIAVSIEEDFLNGGVSGEMDARGIVLLRHLQLFREWNRDPSHPLYGKIKMNRIGLAGHSRGGEGAATAWLYNTTLHNPADPLHDFGFHIRSVLAIAPVDGQLGTLFPELVTIENADYFVMHGSHDGDVSNFQGHKTYDRALPVAEETTGEKGLLFIQGGNHGQFNTIWAPGGDPFPVGYSTTPLIAAADQQQVAKLFTTAWFRWTLQGRRCYRMMAAGEIEFDSFPDDVVLSRQYQNHTRTWLNHYEEDNDPATTSIPGGANVASGFVISNEQAMTGSGAYGEFVGETDGHILAWDAGVATYTVQLPDTLRIPLDADMLALRIGQLYESSDQYNVFGTAQDVSVSIVVDGVTSDPVYASDYRELVSQCHVRLGTSYNTSMTVLETVRIPLEDFDGGSPVDPAAVEEVVLTFDRSESGLIGIDEIQFTEF
ncbi:MAG: hypothetical protein P9L99_11580 [Candidatus Lernaella stagnicola]|nr:hypothetical protein [Candidatus Lernaella stagnicola]